MNRGLPIRYLLAADHASFVGSGVVLANSDSGGALLGSGDLGVALDLGAALDGASGVLGYVAFASRNGSSASLRSLDFGVALNLDALRVAWAHGLLGKHGRGDNGGSDEGGDEAH